MTQETKPVTGRIKIGASCMQDFRFFRWPLPDVDPDTKFEFTPGYRSLTARADGFGLHQPDGRYGSGAVSVYGRSI